MYIFKEKDIINKKYKVISIIGEGGFGEVYKVLSHSDRKIYALKILKKSWTDTEKIIQRFQKEIQILTKLNHQSLIRIFDVNLSGNLIYYVMEYLTGENLEQFLSHKDILQPEWLLAFLNQLLQSLSFLHENKILHRDLKPSNIFILKSSNSNDLKINNIPQIKILDLGIAKIMGSMDTRTINEIIGTPQYMAPERLEKGDCWESSDIYSIAEIMWNLITGMERCPFKETTAIIAFKNKSPQMKQINNYAKRTKQSKKLDFILLKKWISKALQPDPAKRFPSSKEALKFIESSSIKSKIKLNMMLCKMTLLIVLLLAFACSAFLLINYFNSRHLDHIESFITYITAFDKKEKPLWYYNDVCMISNAIIMKNLSPSIKEAVVITTRESSPIYKESAQCGKIMLLNSHGQIIWMKQLGRKEWIPDTGSMYNNLFWFAEDFDKDNKKELVFSSSNQDSYPGIAFILRPDNGDLYGIIWNKGNILQYLTVWNQNSKKYLALVSNNTGFETKMISWIETNHAFWTMSPGWSSKDIIFLEKAMQQLGKDPEIKYKELHMALWNFIPNPINGETILKKNANHDFFIIAKANGFSYYYNLEGYPTDDKGKNIFPSNNLELNPNKFLWKLNPAFSYLNSEKAKEAVLLYQNLLPRSPHIPQFHALLYLLLGKATLLMNDQGSAIEFFKKSLTEQNEGNRAKIHLAEALILSRQYIEAQKILKAASSEMKSIDYDHEINKYLIYINDLTNADLTLTKRPSALRSQNLLYGYYGTSVMEQQLLYEGNISSIPLEYYCTFQQSEEFWRWRVAREILLQNKSLKDSLKQVPEKYFKDPGLIAMKDISESSHKMISFTALENLAQHNLEAYLFLSPIYIMYAHAELEQNNLSISHVYAMKALQSDAIGYIKILAKNMKELRK